MACVSGLGVGGCYNVLVGYGKVSQCTFHADFVPTPFLIPQYSLAKLPTNIWFKVQLETT